MQRLALTILPCLLASVAAASGSFELKDPAAEVYAERNEPVQEPESLPQPQSPPQPQAQGGMHCTVDIDSGECFCIGKASAKKLALSQQDCAAQIRQALEKQAGRVSVDP